MSIIEIKHLRKEYPGVVPLKDVNAEVEKGEVISIIGPSGTGKSTLIRCINRMETPTSGQIIMDGTDMCAPDTDLPKMRRKMGMVFQNYALFSHMPVIDNLTMAPVDLLGMSMEDAVDQGMDLLKLVGLRDKADSWPNELSGGQRQRVAIARALAMKPEILLFDEPTSALDPQMVSEVLSVITRLAEQGLTMLIVTHEMRFARDASTRVFYMDRGEVWESGTPKQIFEDPERKETRDFILRIRNWNWEIRSLDHDYVAMSSSLQEFCARQFLDQRMSLKCQLAVEEITSSFLIPVAREHGITDPEISYQLSVGEGREEADLVVSLDKYKASGIEADTIIETADDISKQLLDSVVKRTFEDENGQYHFVIG